MAMERNALSAAYDRHGDGAYRLACALTGNDRAAQDLVADAFAQVAGLAGQRSLSDVAIVDALFSRIRDAARSKGGAYANAASALPSAERRAVELAYFGGLTVSDIARAVSRSELEVARLLRSALSALRTALPRPVMRIEPAEVRRV
jgi:DNA-directed RNA polymerase specialized sigma24 family protein